MGTIEVPEVPWVPEVPRVQVPKVLGTPIKTLSGAR